MTTLIRPSKIFLALLLSWLNYTGLSQTNNPCGVVAAISPSVADSVVPVNTLIPFINTSVNATSVEWLLDGFFSGSSGDLFNYQITTGIHTISLVAHKDNCTDTITVVYFSAGIAHDVDSFLLAHYGTYRYNEEPTCIDKAADGNIIVGGVQYLWDACGEAGILVKIKDKGCIDWSKKFLSPYYCNNSKVTALYASADTNYYVAISNFELAKLDRNGNLLWTRRYFMNNQSVAIQSISGDSQGSVYVLTNASWFNFFNGWSVTKLDNNGNVVWSKLFRLSYEVFGSGPGQSEFITPSGIVLLNNKIYVCGNAYSQANATYFSFITKLNAADGNKEWQYGYTDPNYPGAMGFVHLTLYDTILLATSGAQGQIMTLIDATGMVRKNIKTHFSTNYGPKATKADVDKKGHIYVMQWSEESLPLQPYYWYSTSFAEIDTSLNKYWGAIFEDYQRSAFVDATMGGDNKFAAVGYHYGYVTDAIYASRDIRLFKVDTVRSDLFCYGYDTSFSIAPEPINQLNFDYLIDSALTITIGDATPYTVVDAYLQSRYNCPDFLDSCSYVKLSGPRSVCNYNDTYTYRIHRNKKCPLVPQFSLPGGVTLVSQTDSTLVLRFGGYGTYKVMAVLQSCIPSMDSINIIVAPKNDIPLELGPDKVICPNNNIVLHAGPGFLSYLWNDGSADSVFTAIQTGKYLVEVTDSCGNLKKDSVIVMPFDELINIGPDRIKCNSDTVHLNAPPGYISYIWSNNYNISSTTVQQVIVNPATDTAYYLAAEKYPGCLSYDTVRIKVNLSPPIVLGTDKVFCQGDSAMLDAGAGFAQYQWSNGSSLQQIAVYSTGNYSVIATTTEGCKSYDTLGIINVWANPVVTLDHNPELCTDNTRILNAGNFPSYLWQNGSTLSSFIANDIGIYYVTVQDNHQCKGSDTVRITRLLPLPADFLPDDTAICIYGSLIIKPTNDYKNYSWSNNAVSPSINITVPGMYWLQVTDASNCVGRDSILVNSKECLNGFYIPNAFTPNNDGLNDDFKPFIGGIVKQYQFTIYNRWGQVIFTTKDLSRGWDGTFVGQLQDTNVFAWMCTYQLEGEGVKVEKGTVVVIR